MELIDEIFGKEFIYNKKLVNKMVTIIRYDKRPERVDKYKLLLFKMLKTLVLKNVRNYFNLCKNAEHRIFEQMDEGEYIAESYIVFQNCLEKYTLNATYDFYFYFNKALSQHFYAFYRREGLMGNYELTDGIAVHSDHVRVEQPVECSMQMLMENLGFTNLEKRILFAKMNKELSRPAFLKKNPDITPEMYKEAMASIQQKGQILKGETDDDWQRTKRSGKDAGNDWFQCFDFTGF
jgi:hypothetical protein